MGVVPVTGAYVDMGYKVCVAWYWALAAILSLRLRPITTATAASYTTRRQRALQPDSPGTDGDNLPASRNRGFDCQGISLDVRDGRAGVDLATPGVKIRPPGPGSSTDLAMSVRTGKRPLSIPPRFGTPGMVAG